MNYSDRLFMIYDSLKEQGRINTYVELAEILGTNKAGVSDLKSGRKKVSLDNIESMIKSYPNINLNWLIAGEGTMFSNSIVKTDIDTVTKSLNHLEREPRDISLYSLKTDYYNQDKQLIPVYEIEGAAGLSTIFSNQNQQVPLDYISVPNAPKCDGAIYVRGDSMYPILKAGDIVCYKTINSVDDIYWGEMYLLDMEVSGDQYLTFKYVQKSDLGDEYVRLVSHNSHHNPKDVKKTDIRALAIVKVSIRYNTVS